MAHDPPKPTHVTGTRKGEEYGAKSRESGRDVKDKNGYRSSRDSTSINPDHHGPIDPRMPEMPPS